MNLLKIIVFWNFHNLKSLFDLIWDHLKVTNHLVVYSFCTLHYVIKTSNITFNGHIIEYITLSHKHSQKDEYEKHVTRVEYQFGIIIYSSNKLRTPHKVRPFLLFNQKVNMTSKYVISSTCRAINLIYPFLISSSGLFTMMKVFELIG